MSQLTGKGFVMLSIAFISQCKIKVVAHETNFANLQDLCIQLGNDTVSDMSYQPTWKCTMIELKDRLFIQHFSYKVMTIFTTHNCCFNTFRRLVVAREYMERKLILFEAYCCQLTTYHVFTKERAMLSFPCSSMALLHSIVLLA